MNINQLKYFVALAEELNFTRAARRLHISQPPLSKQIALLEEELEVRLFNRTSRRVELTEAGRIYLYEVKAILARLSRATARARSVEQGMEGIVEVGLSSSHFLGPVPQLIAQCSMLAPDIHLVLNEMRPSDQILALMDRTIDISIGRSRAVVDGVFKSVLLWHDPPVVAMLTSHPLAEYNQLQLKQLMGQRLVLLERDSSSFASGFHTLCTQMGMDLRRSQLVEEVPALLYLVEAGLGIAVVPASAARRVMGLVSRPLIDLPLSMDVYALVRLDNTKTAIWTFIELARQFQSAVSQSASDIFPV
ncbi:LysR family transcriptional regulator [Pollutimonas harenae]|uniref:LysR family transcriptional regulator n=1 Tax=Pollutimonas harenae TaxID=657015 RepID=A0A853GPK9_9BURK|nr:LysR substrate-binding domain-containing protein [Pollutimonas harenae]NYT84021.1 LysR family transcriptional regulator [Pollutimonas harenae]TEA73553.1 LysR family transcriptional regulator [Pollutimonas harenae]